MMRYLILPLQLENNLGGQQRVATEVEKVVVPSDGLNLQILSPNCGHFLF